MIAFAKHVPKKRMAEIVAAHRAAHAERLAGYEQVSADAKADDAAEPAKLATLDFGIRYERALLGWFDELPTLLPELDAP